MTRHMAAALRALMGASFALGGCSGSSSDGPVQPGGGGAAKLAFTVQPSNAVAGAAIAPAVQVTIEDAQGNTVTTASNSVTLAIGTNPGGGTLSGTATAAAVNGVASFSTLGVDKAAAGYTLAASATGLTSATSSAFNVIAAAPAKLAFTVQPTNAAAGAAITPAMQVAILDAHGNTVTTATNSITLALGTNPGSGTLSGTTTISAVNGVATFASLGVDKAATGYTLTASAPGLTGATSSAFDIGAGAAAKLTFIVQPSNAVAGATITPAVQVAVQDAQGNTVTTATNSVALAIGTNPAGGILSGATAVAAVNGVATFSTLSVNNSGVGYTLTASATGVTGATSTSFTISTPTTVGGAPFRLSVGTDATCGVAIGGAAYCWGGNASGDLGTGSVGSPSFVPVAVTGGLAFASISAGEWFACGLTTSGAAYCWGYNHDGQLGNGSTVASSSTPVAVSGGLSFASVSAGTNSACGVTRNGAAYCWGGNSWGQLGNGATASSSTPVAVAGGLAFATVSAGNHACGVTTAGLAYCWGANLSGELGSGSTAAYSSTPVAVSGGLSFVSVSAGANSTCGVTVAGAGYCWGDNTFGQLGSGTTALRNTPTAVLGGHTFATVATAGGAGGASSCGVTTTGAAYCWGYNVDGELGNGTTTRSLTPVAVSGGLTFATVSTHQFTACGLTTAGAAYCWGYNAYGQLGNGSTTRSLIPVAVSGGLAF